jgi:hypothetical protein
MTEMETYKEMARTIQCLKCLAFPQKLLTKGVPTIPEHYGTGYERARIRSIGAEHMLRTIATENKVQGRKNCS